MVAMYVNGEKIGTLAGAEQLLELLARNTRVELRDDAGTTVGSVQPPPADVPCPWDPTITREELDRRLTEPTLTTEEMFQRLGWE
jgi:hypothetical protein